MSYVTEEMIQRWVRHAEDGARTLAEEVFLISPPPWPAEFRRIAEGKVAAAVGETFGGLAASVGQSAVDRVRDAAINTFATRLDELSRQAGGGGV